MSAPVSPNFTHIEPSHPLYRLVGPLMAGNSEVYERLHGTAFLIAPGYALTATHVVVDYLEKIQRSNVGAQVCKPGHHTETLTFFMFILIQLPDGRSIPLNVHKTYGSTPGDIALLAVSRPPNIEWSEFGPYPTLRMAPPAIGTHISALGYPGSTAERQSDGIVNIRIWPRLAIGQVMEHHGERRDPLLLNFPCFRVNAKFDGGMSGAPVLDDAGAICGVVSKGYDLPEDEEPISYAACIWPAVRIGIDDLPPMANDKRRLLDLVHSNTILVVDAHRVQGGFSEDGRFVSVLLQSSDA